ncbi:dirigent protein 22-like isoform X2 [Panicum hallii]|uniref:dirigent protein 22-like isoform X2 n=1 Tax=Panicum hallii TaxID=206008 RepID=UPI000DF4F060|nr:dirigent protein 22-like isoform X2 [Panicum hallii]
MARRTRAPYIVTPQLGLGYIGRHPPAGSSNDTPMAAAAAAAVPLLLLLAAAAASPASAAAGGGKQTHIKLYWHDVLSGPNPTAVQVARAAVTNTSKTSFGLVVVIDDPLTEGPDLNSSTPLGRAQGTYVAAGRDEVALLVNMNFVFQGGRYNGSTVAIMGRNAVFDAVREMAVVGGTGVFRMARGYAQARTHTLDLKTGDAIVDLVRCRI